MLALLVVTGCGGPGGAVAPVDELSDHPRHTAVSHRVAAGDTLYAIAFLYGLDYQQLATWNGIRSPYLIRVGQRLRLSPPATVARAPSAAAAKRSAPSVAARPAAKPVAKPVAKAARLPARRSAPSATQSVVPPPRVAARPKPAPATSGSGSAGLRWRWPTDGKLLSTFSSRRPGRKGIDIGGKRGQPVVAAAAGEVVYSGNGLQRYYGQLIIIKHNERFLSAYAHNDRLLVKEGEQVKAGQRIAALGDSGTDRVKLHFEIRRDGQPVNPMRYLPKH
ncbi:peptidoglycan DD-metalloendopeptidase family protein [Endothiovibrio diazotrophicus]